MRLPFKLIVLAIPGTMILLGACSNNEVAELKAQLNTQATQIAELRVGQPSSQGTPLDNSKANATSRTADTDQVKMASMLDVQLTAIELLPEDKSVWRFSDHLNFTFTYRNKGNESIKAFTGSVRFADSFDRPIKTLNLTYENPIPAGHEVVDDDKGIELNQFSQDDDRLKAGKLGDTIRVSFQPQSIILADGKQLGKANK